MTLGEFRQATKDLDDNMPIIIDATGNPVWYLVDRSRTGDKRIFLMDKSVIDLGIEIDSAEEFFGISDELFSYLQKNGVTLDDIKRIDGNLYNKALNFYK